ncbi:mitochondrial aaa [Colletotrichum sojae]|uniref:Mitochondrial aaa n=1 Tax=Colletotrichum sojae TaxID=2175907 RepID=A0A8H6IUD1_9PEZI|nr:mitochondrial aaa [Colletotrichum sojae]
MAGDRSDRSQNSQYGVHRRIGNLGETPTTADVQGIPRKSSSSEANSSQPASTHKPSKSKEDQSSGELSELEDEDSEVSCEEIEREYNPGKAIPPSETNEPVAEALIDEEFKHEDRYYGEESVRVSPYKYQPELVPPFMQWIMEHCVKTCDEWADTPDVLKLRDADLPATGGSSTGAKDEFSTLPGETATYEMASILLEPLLGIVKTTKSGIVFTKTIMRLQTPTIPFPHMTARFLKSVVQEFAKTLDVDLMTLCHDDLQDLVDFLGGKETSHVSSSQDWPFLFKGPQSSFTQSYSSDSSRRSSISYSDDQENPPTVDGVSADDGDAKRKARGMQMTFHQPFFKFLHFPRLKRSAAIKTLKEQPMERPLIVHLMPNHEDFDDALLRTLKNSGAWRIGSTSVLFIISTQNDTQIEKPSGPPSHHGGNTCACHSTVNSMAVVPVAPIRSARQEALMAKDGRLEVRSRNMRALKRAIRRRFPQHQSVSLLDPFDEWAFLDAVPDVAELFEKAPLPPANFNGVLQMVGDNLSAERLKRAIVNIKTTERALEGWQSWKGPESAPDVPKQDEESSSSPRSKWDRFPPAIQKTVQEIQSATPKNVNDRFYWESMFLDLVVNPGVVAKGWSDIAIDPETAKEVRELVKQHTNAALGPKSKSYGVLKQSHIGGALLYGPPGTGKTQLARVLACESGQVVICVTAADIENKWAGEMPKAIRGLFNLGTLLAPSIIFIDEADSLFAARTSAYNMPWRRQNVNMMLAEMDGLLKSPKTPFVLLSTNLPGDLDPAVLRRVPSHLYLGLPSRETRAKIFEIVLREEVLYSDISHKLLALMTHGYSGSDIRTACIQAAMICNTYGKIEGGETRRILTRDVFEQALERTQPSVNKLAIAYIKSFAMENDPAALVKMQEFDKDEDLVKKLWADINKRVDENQRHGVIVPIGDYL